MRKLLIAFAAMVFAVSAIPAVAGDLESAGGPVVAATPPVFATVGSVKATMMTPLEMQRVAALGAVTANFVNLNRLEAESRSGFDMFTSSNANGRTFFTILDNPSP